MINEASIARIPSVKIECLDACCDIKGAYCLRPQQSLLKKQMKIFAFSIKIDRREIDYLRREMKSFFQLVMIEIVF